jgi:hypothetical protein
MVTKFLTANPQLIELLTEVYIRIPKYFDLDTVCNLEVFDDSEDQQCFLLIQTKYCPEEALVRLNQLYHSWWFGVASELRAKLHIDVEYV